MTSKEKGLGAKGKRNNERRGLRLNILDIVSLELEGTKENPGRSLLRTVL